MRGNLPDMRMRESGCPDAGKGCCCVCATPLMLSDPDCYQVDEAGRPWCLECWNEALPYARELMP